MGNTAKQNSEKTYDANMAVLRIIASFFVVMIHSTTVSGIGIAYNSLARFAVPVFVMLSGYYMLAREIPLSKILRKTAKLFSLVLIWSAIYLINPVTRGAHPVDSPENIVKYLLTQPFHIWYLYAAIGLYLFTPVFQVFTKNAGKPQYHYALGLTFLFGSVFTIMVRFEGFSLLSQLLEMMKLPYTLGFCFLYLLGGYFRKFGISHPNILFALGAIGTLFTLGGSLLLHRSGLDHTALHSFFAPGVILSAVGVFSLSKKLEGVRAHPAIRELSECTLGIYLLHPYVTLMIFVFFDVLQNTLPEALYTPVRTSISFGISAVMIFLLRRIPFLNKILL